MKVMKAIYRWTVTGFDICPEDSVKVTSPTFSHTNSSKWCVELVNDAGKLTMCFHLVASNDSVPVTATLKASLLDQDGAEIDVYPADVHSLKINGRSPRQNLLADVSAEKLGKNWNFKCEVCTVEVVLEDTSSAFEEELLSAVAKDLQHLLVSKDFTDITLSVGGVRLEAHRAILCARSPVFRAMLSHDTKEAQEGLIEILDMEPEVVSEMLRYMYTDRVQVPSDSTKQLVIACDKYGLQDAKLICELELARKLSVDNAANTAVLAVVYSCSSLQEACVAFIKQNLEQVVGTGGWADIVDKYPEVVKTISELVTKGSERYSSPSDTSGLQSNVDSVDSSAKVPVSKYITPNVGAASLDTAWDTGYTHCERKKVVYEWKLVGLTDWPQGRDFIASPSFWHPETIQWELRLYKRDSEYQLFFMLLKNKAGGSVRANMGVATNPIGENYEMCKLKEQTIKEQSRSATYIRWPLTNNDTLTLLCEISIMCVLQHCRVANKSVLQSDLRQDLYSLLESGNVADFKLCAGTVEMGAHRAVLAARSTFFARILQPGSEVLKKGLLEVSDVKPGALTEALHYIYTGKVKNLDSSTAELLAVAHRFELSHLKADCAMHLSRQLTVDNAVSTAVCAIENLCPELLKTSVGFIRSHFKQVMGGREWSETIDRSPEAFKKICQLVAEPAK